MKIIPVKMRDKDASVPVLVDDEDFEILTTLPVWKGRKRKWDMGNRGYPTACINGKTTCAHKLLVNRPNGMYTDHIDGNKLNNQKDNLRIVTRSQNGMNRGPQSNNQSGYKGIYWVKQKEKWRAQIGVDGKQFRIGYFDTKEDAYEAYKEAAKKLHGEFAKV